MAVSAFAERVLDNDPQALLVVLGDLNEFADRPPLVALAGARLKNLMLDLAEDDRYTFIYQGNSQTLDHILVSAALVPLAEVDVVHVNADFPARDRASDHDPVVARFTFLSEPAAGPEPVVNRP